MELLTDHNSGFLQSVDLRLKFLFSILIVIIVIQINTILEVGVLFGYIVLISISFHGLSTTIQRLWGLKYFILSFVIFYILLFNALESVALLIIIAKFLVLVTAFNTISQSINPDQITQALLGLKLPATFSWTISLTLRQFYFISDEISMIWDLYGLKLRSKRKLSDKIKIISPFFTSILAMSVQRAVNLRKSLQARGFQRAHTEIITYVQYSLKHNFTFFFLFTFPLLVFLIGRSQLFMSLF